MVRWVKTDALEIISDPLSEVKSINKDEEDTHKKNNNSKDEAYGSPWW